MRRSRGKHPPANRPAAVSVYKEPHHACVPKSVPVPEEPVVRSVRGSLTVTLCEPSRHDAMSQYRQQQQCKAFHPEMRARTRAVDFCRAVLRCVDAVPEQPHLMSDTGVQTSGSVVAYTSCLCCGDTHRNCCAHTAKTRTRTARTPSGRDTVARARKVDEPGTCRQANFHWARETPSLPQLETALSVRCVCVEGQSE